MLFLIWINEFDFLNKKDLITMYFNKGIKKIVNYIKTEINDNIIKLKSYYFDYPKKKDIVLIKL